MININTIKFCNTLCVYISNQTVLMTTLFFLAGHVVFLLSWWFPMIPGMVFVRMCADKLDQELHAMHELHVPEMRADVDIAVKPPAAEHEQRNSNGATFSAIQVQLRAWLAPHNTCRCNGTC